MGEIVIYFNIIFFLLFTLWVYRYHFHNKCLLFVSILYLVSSITGLIYYYSEEAYYTDLSISGAIYFYAFFVVSIIPIYKIDYLGIRKIETNDRFLNILCLVIFYCSFYPLIYQLISLVSLLKGDFTSAISDAHDNRMQFSIKDGGGLLYNLSIKISSWCNNILPILLVYILQRYKKINRYVFGIFFSQLALAIGAFTSSSRSFIVDYYLSYVFIYCLFYNYLTGYAKVFYTKLVKYVGLVVLMFLMIITISRAVFLDKNDFKSTMEWVSQYAGEGMLNFNEYIVPQKFTKGVNDIFPYLLPKSKFEFYKNASNRDIDSYWSKYTSKPEYVFYTSYGNIVDGFGILPSLIGVTILSVILCIYLKKRRYYLSSIALFVLYSRYVYYGFMLFPYSGISGNKYLLQSLFVISLLYIIEKCQKIKVI